MQALRHFLLALQFFTRIPVTGRLAHWVGYSPEMLRASAAHFPGVGGVVGGAACTVFAALCLYLPSAAALPLVAAVLSTAVSVLLTGGFHEDGLADVSDGLGGSYQRERALEIMKDSRIGAFGAMALVLVLLSKVSLLALLGQVSLAAAAVSLWLAHVVSRGLPLLTIRWLPHVGDHSSSKSKPLADQISTHGLWAGLTWVVAATVLAWTVSENLPVHWLGAAPSPQHLQEALVWGLAGAGLGWWLMHWRLSRRLGGYTGDGLGACQQLSELGFYLGVAFALGPL